MEKSYHVQIQPSIRAPQPLQPIWRTLLDEVSRRRQHSTESDKIIEDLAKTLGAFEQFAWGFLRHDFSERHLRICLASLLITYGRDSTDAWIQKTKHWETLTGIDENHVREQIDELCDKVKANVLESRTADNGDEEIRLNPEIANWMVTELVTWDEIQDVRSQIGGRKDNRQIDFFRELDRQPERDFQDAVHEGKVEKALTNIVSPNSGEQVPNTSDARTPSPDLGEGRPAAGVNPDGPSSRSNITSPETGDSGSPTVTGTETERLFTVVRGERQRSRTEIADRAVRALPLAYRTKAQRQYFLNFFEPVCQGRTNPPQEIVAPALWSAALQYEVSDKTSVRRPPCVLTDLYFDERDRLLKKEKERRAQTQPARTPTHSEANACLDDETRRAIRAEQMKQLCADVSTAKPETSDSANV